MLHLKLLYFVFRVRCYSAAGPWPGGLVEIVMEATYLILTTLARLAIVLSTELYFRQRKFNDPLAMDDMLS
ncbi:hypothetical protein BDR07DRAFT_1438562 [Suillus spraguei]|nr:hypothetical protein BDR07DRAFT_1438562 [Suillus spraguei]